MKKNTGIFWISTGFIFLFEGVLPTLTSQTQLAVDGIRHLGYPDYFGVLLTVFKVLGAITLIVPAIKTPYKEWAYTGFGIVFISAAVSHFAVDGFGGMVAFPIIVFGILCVSYISYHKIHSK